MDIKSLFKKKTIIIAGIAVTGLIVLFAIYYFTIPALLFDADKAAEKAGETLYNGLGLQLSYEKASFKVFPRPSVVLERPALKSKMGRLVFDAERVNLGNSYLSYIFLTPKLASVDIYDAELNLDEGDIKQVDIEKAEKVKASVYLHSCNASLSFGERVVSFDELDGRLKLRSEWGKEHRIFGKLSAERLYFSDDTEYTGPAVKLAVDGDVLYLVSEDEGNDTVKFDSVEVLLGDAKLNVSGMTQVGEGEKTIDMALRGNDMALSQVVPALLPNLAEMDFDGAMDLGLAITGEWGGDERPLVDGELSIKDGSVSIEDGDGISSMQGKVAFNDKIIDIESVSGVTAEGNFNVKGVIELSEGTPFELFLSGVFPMEIVAALLDIDPRYKVGGLARLDMDLNGDTIDPLGTSIEGSAEMLGNSVRLKPFILPFNDLRGTVYFDGFKAKIGKLEGKLAGSHFEAGGELRGYKNPDITFTAVSDSIDFDAALPRDKKHLEKISKRGDAPLGLDKKGLRIEGGLRFKRCKVFGIKSQNMKADLSFADNNLVFKSLQFEAYEGKATATGNVLFSSPPGYSFTGKIEDIRIGVFLDDNDYLDGALSGKFSGDVAFTAQSLDKDIFNKTFNGRGVLKHKGGRAADIKVLKECAKWSHIDHFNPLQISELETLAVANGGFISTERMYIKNSDMEMDVAGRISLYEGVDLKVSVLFNPAATSAIGRDSDALTLINDEEGRGRLNFKIKGTLDDPSFVLDADKAFFKDGDGNGDSDPPDVDIDPEDLDIFR